MRRYYCDSCGKGASRQLTVALKNAVKKAKVAWTLQIEDGVLGRTNPTTTDPEGDQLQYDGYQCSVWALQVRKTHQVGPDVGPTSAFYSCYSHRNV